MANEPEARTAAASIEERRLELDARRLALEGSFARKWLPTVATAVIGLSVAGLGFVQNKLSNDSTERARIEARAKDEREWGFKIVEMYFQKRELFDLSLHPEQASANLRVLVAVAPSAVQGLLSAEQSRLPPPGGDEAQQAARLSGLAAVADIQGSIAAQASQPPAAARDAASFTVYVQYPEGQETTARAIQAGLQHKGYKAPGIEQVARPPSRLQVRYYRADQKELAARMAVSIGQAVHLPASADNAIRVQSDKPLPDGILEVWLPPAPASAASQ